MLRKAFWILALGALLLTPPGSALAPQPTARSAGMNADGAAIYLPFIARPAAPITVDLTFQFSQTVQPQGDTRQLAVAFHAVEYIDAGARTLGELTFGTPEANAAQGQGWFANEVWPDATGAEPVGPFQWAGGAQRRATVRLSVPGNTEGLLFDLTSVVDGMWMDVSVDGQLAASVLVDAFYHWGAQDWHQAYVPLAAATPEAEDPGQPLWTEGRYFPTFPATDRVYAIRVNHQLYDPAFAWSEGCRLNQRHEAMMALTLVGMQGVINRSGPRVLLRWFPGARQAVTQHWIPQLRQHTQVVSLDLDGLSAFNFLYRRFAPRFAGAVVYDPEVPDTINLATMIAGLEDRIILAPDQLGLPGIPAFDSVTDLRPLAAHEGWDATEEGKYRLYLWAYNNLWPRMEKRIIGLISPGPPTSRRIGEGPDYFPPGMAARDLIVALRLPALWLSPLEEPQASLFDRFLEDAPSPVPVFGFFAGNEEGTVAMASRHGDWVPVITNGLQPVSGGNLTVLSAFRPQIKPYAQPIDPQRIMETIGERPVATIYTSDGDSMIYLLNQGFGNFPWEQVQGHRFGWTINPVLAELAPVVWNHYMDSADQVGFVCGFSGAGYTIPAWMDRAELTDYLAATAGYLEETGLRTVLVGSHEQPWGHSMAAAYADALADSGYLGAVVGGRPSIYAGSGFYYAGVPTPGTFYSYDASVDDRAWIVQDLLAQQPGVHLVDLATCPWTGGRTVADADASGGQALLFSRNEPFTDAEGRFAAMAAGDYTVVFRLKVTDCEASEPIARLYCGAVYDPSTGQGAQESIHVAPRDFDVCGEYQDFTLSFTLEHSAAETVLGIAFLGGTTAPPGSWASGDLYGDTIRAERVGGLDLPVFATIAVITTLPGHPDNVLLADELEAAGVVVLYPDEFMAALNPEYMIEFAIPYLGAGHPAIAEANQQLADGYYMKSLLTIRKALRDDGLAGEPTHR